MTTLFRYDALRGDGSRERGAVPAPSRDAALRVLRERGLHPLSTRAARLGAKGYRLPLKDLALGLRALADLTTTGMPIARALAIFTQIAPKAWSTILPAISSEIRQGGSLAAALNAMPGAVQPTVIAMIRAGERGDGVSGGLTRAAETLEESVATRSALLGALTYPIVLATVGVISVAFLIAVVLPRLASLVTGLGQDLPPSTRVLLRAGQISAATWTLIGLLSCGIGAAWWRWVSTTAGREEWHTLLLRIPVIGAVRRSTATVRACAATSALLETGVPIAAALVHAAEASGDAAIAKRIVQARESVVAGASLSRALTQQAALAETAIQLIRVGEENGRLGAMLRHAARIERERAMERMRATVRAIEPAMILVFGGIIAFVAAALLQAVYSIRPGA